MDVKRQWAEARERGRQQREAENARLRRQYKDYQLRSLGVPVPASIGELDPAQAEEALDAMLAAEQERRAELYEEFARIGTVTTFRALGVQVLTGGGVVYTIGVHEVWKKENSSRPLGPLAGAEAKVTDSTSTFSPGKALIMPIGVAPLARKEAADAMIVFPDGLIHSVKLDGSKALRDARRQCIEFNALAGPATPATPGNAGDDPGLRLKKLQDLVTAGLLSQDEYDAKRAEVIASI